MLHLYSMFKWSFRTQRNQSCARHWVQRSHCTVAAATAHVPLCLAQRKTVVAPHKPLEIMGFRAQWCRCRVVSERPIRLDANSPAKKQTLQRPEWRDMRISVVWLIGRMTPSSRQSQQSVLTAIPNRPRAQTANTLLSNVSTFLPHRLIPQPQQQGAPPAERRARRGKERKTT